MNGIARERTLQHIRWEGRLNLFVCWSLALADTFLARSQQRCVYVLAILPYRPLYTYPAYLV